MNSLDQTHLSFGRAQRHVGPFGSAIGIADTVMIGHLIRGRVFGAVSTAGVPFSILWLEYGFSAYGHDVDGLAVLRGG